jgi:molybdopterin-guanine dinucleotide biosynthesis protein A
MGRPKGELTLDGVPILDRLLDRLAWPGPTLLVTAPGRERPPAWERFDREAVDPVADEGPLRGVLTALARCQTPLLAVTTVDMPNVTRGQFEWLVGQLGEADVGVMCRRERVEPFPLLLRTSAVELVRARLDQRRRSVHGLAEAGGIVVRPMPDDWAASVWVNLNTPGDVAGFTAPFSDGPEGRQQGGVGPPGRR